MWGLLFRLGVDTALALCNHSLTLVYVDVSMRRHRVKNKEGKLLKNQTTVIVDITITTKLVRATEQMDCVQADSIVPFNHRHFAAVNVMGELNYSTDLMTK
jgi:hypothetical protein